VSWWKWRIVAASPGRPERGIVSLDLDGRALLAVALTRFATEQQSGADLAGDLLGYVLQGLEMRPL
jgi:hypothetical protein